MGIIEQRKQQKASRIASIKAALKAIKKEGLTLDYTGLLMETMSQFKISRKTAREDVQQAMHELKTTKQKMIDGKFQLKLNL